MPKQDEAVPPREDEAVPEEDEPVPPREGEPVPEDVEFAAAPADLITRMLSAFVLLVLGLLGFGSLLPFWRAAGSGAWLEALRTGGFAAVAVGGAVLVVARVPVRYRLTRDERWGLVLAVERALIFRPVRLRLALYAQATPLRRVYFAWMPLLSGLRLFGLRGGRFEEMLLGFWSFGRNGRRAVLLTGPGRPRTLVTPCDPARFLEALGELGGPAPGSAAPRPDRCL